MVHGVFCRAVPAWRAVGSRMPRMGARSSANLLLASPTYSRASAAVPPWKPERHGIRMERMTRTERIAPWQHGMLATAAAGRPSLGSHPRLVKTEKARNGTETARNTKAVAVSGGFGAVSGRFGLFTFVNASWLRWPGMPRVIIPQFPDDRLFGHVRDDHASQGQSERRPASVLFDR